MAAYSKQTQFLPGKSMDKGGWQDTVYGVPRELDTA